MWNKNIETMEQNITTKRTKLAKEQIGSNHGTKLWSGKQKKGIVEQKIRPQNKSRLQI
jgi:hypothetical protein